MVLDGKTLYVDRNANGDLTEADEKLEAQNPTDGSNKFGGSGSYTHFDVIPFTMPTGKDTIGKFKLQHWIRAEGFKPTTDFDRDLHQRWLKHGYEIGTLYRVDGLGQAQNGVAFVRKPAEAEVRYFDGPLTFTVRMPQYQVLKRGDKDCDLAFCIGTHGRRTPCFGDHEVFSALATNEVPEGAHLIADVTFPGKSEKDQPITKRFFLKDRC
jgi:hypothetical protein